MKKIPGVFMRNMDTDKLCRDEVTPGCEWVLAGEGIATRKWDGTACAVIGGVLHMRYDAKNGKPAPVDGIPCQEPDPITGHWPHWIPVGDRPEGKWHREAWTNSPGSLGSPLPDGTYELCGPRVGANPDGFTTHVFRKHGDEVLTECPRSFTALREYLHDKEMEGVVFHHPDGRMAKVKRTDFGFAWGSKKGPR